MNKKPLRIALVRLTALGDIINGTIVLQLIKKHYPDAQIEWFCEEAFASILNGHPDLKKSPCCSYKTYQKDKRLYTFKSNDQSAENFRPFRQDHRYAGPY